MAKRMNQVWMDQAGARSNPSPAAAMREQTDHAHPRGPRLAHGADDLAATGRDTTRAVAAHLPPTTSDRPAVSHAAAWRAAVRRAAAQVSR